MEDYMEVFGYDNSEPEDAWWNEQSGYEKYEAYISGDMEDEASDPEDEIPVELLPTETDLQNLETLESVRGLLSVIKENNTTFYDAVQEYQTEALVLQQETAVLTEGILYCNITECIMLGIIAGSFVAHTFFERMRAG